MVGAQTVLTERFSGRRAELDAYLLLGATLDYPVADRTSVYLRVDNLLDADYVTAYDRPGIPRTVAVGLRVEN